MPQPDVDDDVDLLYEEFMGRKPTHQHDDNAWEAAVAEGWNPEPGFSLRKQAE
jgi:hypothetical protein